MRQSLVVSYISWHYSSALAAIFSIARDYERFMWNFFGIPLLLGTLFSPFQQLEEQARSLSDKAGVMAVNLIMRLTGLFVKSVFIGLWIVGSVLAILGAVIFALMWMMLPVLVLVSIFIGISGVYIS